MASSNTFKIIVKTSFGMEDVVKKELADLGISEVTIVNRAVIFNGTLQDLYKANIWLRTAQKILVEVKSFKISSDSDLYNQIKSIQWFDYFDLAQTFSIDVVVFSKLFSHTKYAALKTKDAIVDKFREKYQSRPNVDSNTPDIKINLYIDAVNNCSISIDSSGEILSKRGFRKSQGLAPIKEDLAAGMILLSDWDKKSTLIDMFCGSGTILLEAAMIAQNIAPNLHREFFGFMNWKNFDAKLFQEIVAEAKKSQLTQQCKIIGIDNSGRSLGMARANLSEAGLLKSIELHCKDFKDFYPPKSTGTIISNPPYEVRIGENVDKLYKEFGDTLKKNYEGYSAWIISSNMEALKNVGLKPEKKIKLFNGSLECRFVNYKMYSGSKKNQILN